ncbi:serine/threonine-protein kinase [Galbitalea soli]|uniref:Serine/threonine protein kinase n=1 Tax=Galbitalea soli TaxID=1268042 RepID=A0A7C9TQ18_9MICO|nr:serine/threonine-protein kinase [Galbitalea soli]NEM90422.1 serine/threonine protein kinase [Galbitalea soli]NYJ31133.1 serine/threonine protein kinase [Galbitalea soli]
MDTENGTGADAPLIGRRLVDRYLVEALVAHGGMASVYRARDESLGRTVALKVFVGSDEHDVRRQRDEVLVLASLNHPALVTLFDATVDPDFGHRPAAIIVMEFVDGTDLGAAIANGPIAPATVAEIGRDIADALRYVHATGIVHRDIKPGNILLPTRIPGAPQRAKLADFGIARTFDRTAITQDGTVIGTAGYLSPEQALGEAATAASDIYALGLSLLEALTGTRAFPGTGAESLAARISTDPVIPESVPPAWGDALAGMTARTPAARPDAGRVVELLADVQRGDAAAASLLAAGTTEVLPAAAPLEEPAAAPPAEPAPTEAMLPPTRVLPVAGELPTAATRVLPAEGASTEPIGASESRPRRRKGVVGAILALAVVLVAVAAIAGGIAGTTATTPGGGLSPTPGSTAGATTSVTPTPVATPTPTATPKPPAPKPGKGHGKHHSKP